jgi:acylphosphatase
MVTTSTQNTRLTGTVTGMVQGVSFRWFVQRRATDLGLVGWVVNFSDGSVGFCAEGPRADLEQLLDAVRAGPPAAAVENVSAQWDTPTGEFHRFEIRF